MERNMRKGNFAHPFTVMKALVTILYHVAGTSMKSETVCPRRLQIKPDECECYYEIELLSIEARQIDHSITIGEEGWSTSVHFYSFSSHYFFDVKFGETLAMNRVLGNDTLPCARDGENYFEVLQVVENPEKFVSENSIFFGPDTSHVEPTIIKCEGKQIKISRDVPVYHFQYNITTVHKNVANFTFNYQINESQCPGREVCGKLDECDCVVQVELETLFAEKHVLKEGASSSAEEQGWVFKIDVNKPGSSSDYKTFLSFRDELEFDVKFGEVITKNQVLSSDPINCYKARKIEVDQSSFLPLTVVHNKSEDSLLHFEGDEFVNIEIKCEGKTKRSYADFLAIRKDRNETVTIGASLIFKASECPKEGGCGGEPHFQTFQGEYFSYHGVCDLLMLQSADFGDGLGLDLHIRTEEYEGSYSIISNAALKIGNDILEVTNDGKHFVNGELGAKLPTKLAHHYWVTKGKDVTEADLFLPDVNHGFTDNEATDAVLFDVQLGNNEHIEFKAWKNFLWVNVVAVGQNFKNSRGLMGTWGKSGKVLRDGVSIAEDPIMFAEDWQVHNSEPKLFQTIRPPQHPAPCLPAGLPVLGRRLGKGRVAEEACAHVKGPKKEFCLFDVMVTGDSELGKAYHD